MTKPIKGFLPLLFLTLLVIQTLADEKPTDIVNGREYEGHYVVNQTGVLDVLLRKHLVIWIVDRVD